MYFPILQSSNSNTDRENYAFRVAVYKKILALQIIPNARAILPHIYWVWSCHAGDQSAHALNSFDFCLPHLLDTNQQPIVKSNFLFSFPEHHETYIFNIPFIIVISWYKNIKVVSKKGRKALKTHKQDH